MQNVRRSALTAAWRLAGWLFTIYITDGRKGSALFFLSVVRAAAADVYVSIRTIERALDACSPSFSRMQQQQQEQQRLRKNDDSSYLSTNLLWRKISLS
jgi:hypothetical protein